MDKKSEISGLLSEIVKAAASEIKTYTTCENFEISNLISEVSDSKGRITEITMISDDLNLIFGVFLHLDFAKLLYSRQCKKQVSDISDKLAIDYIQELCNRCVGIIKRLFVDSGAFRKSNLFQTELPVNKEEANFAPTKQKDSGNWDECWLFKNDLGAFLTWTKLEEKNPNIFAQIRDVKFLPENANNDGDIDFL